MENNSSLSKNYLLLSLKLLQKKDPLLKTLLSLSHQSSSLTQGPILNCSKIASLVERQNPQVCFFGGLSLSLYQKLQPWLKKDSKKKLFFFFEDLTAFTKSISSIAGYTLLQDKQVEVLFLKTPDFWSKYEKLLQKSLGQFFQIYNLTLLPSSFKQLEEQITNLTLVQNTLFSEYLYTSPLVYENLFQNLRFLLKSSSIVSFKNQFQNVPAIICGAGPSINQELPLLKKLKQKALLLAGGRALNILGQASISPHFALGIDPYEMHTETYTQNTCFESPLIYRMRMNHEAMLLHHGPLIHTPQAIGYPLVRWFEKEISITSSFFEEGLNVVNFSMQLAQYMGCSPIILVGSDLAYHEKEAYSSKAQLKQDLPTSGTVEKNDFSIHRGCYKPGISKKPVYTLWKWSEEGKWLSEFAEKHSHIPFLNTSKQGLFLKNFKHISLDQAAKQFLHQSYDLESSIFTIQFQTSKLLKDHKKIDRASLKILESLQRCALLLKELNNHIHPLKEDECQNEIAYKTMLLPLDELFERVEEELEPQKRAQKKYLFLCSMCEKYLSSLRKLKLETPFES